LQAVAQRNPFDRTFKRFLQIHLGETKGEAIPSEPEGRIGIALEQALDVSKNVFDKQKRIRANTLFTIHCFHINLHDLPATTNNENMTFSYKWTPDIV